MAEDTMSVRRANQRRTSSKTIPPKRIKKILSDYLEESDLLKIKEVFSDQEYKNMDQKTLEELLKELVDVEFPPDEFRMIFLKMNIARNGKVNWDEFISYLILEFMEKEISREFESLEAPISKAPRTLRSHHRHPVISVKFYPAVRRDRTFDYLDGNYVTCSKDGMMNYWRLDMELDKTVQSTSPDLIVQTTYVTDFVSMPDVAIVCTSSSERDLRFYDCSARKFDLRVIVVSLESAGTCLGYSFNQSVNVESKLIIGDQGGHIRIISFSPKGRGPFKSVLGVPLQRYRYVEMLKGYAPGFKITEFKYVHSDWVKQVGVYESLNSVVSCAACPAVSVMMRSLSSPIAKKPISIFKVEKGVTCFTISESPHIMATGGLDCTVRIWNPFVTYRPTSTFHGHHTKIIGLIIQDGKKVFSMSADKVIKIWDLSSSTCIQNYYNVPSELGEFSDIKMFYNRDNRQVILASAMIVILEFCPLQNPDNTDGVTHSKPVSHVLYNPLFKIVITVGLDSNIIVWDPWLGRRMLVIKSAHSRYVQGEQVSLEVTAACFDQGYQMLVTGAVDGTVKVWNFNTGHCIRHLNITADCEVAAVAWVGKRLFACGWNKHVVEFYESGGSNGGGSGGTTGKSWLQRHTDDILCIAVNPPYVLVTATYNGEIIMWQLETGQPYKQYNVANPTERIKINYVIEREKHKIGPDLEEVSKTAKMFQSPLRKQSRLQSVSQPPEGGLMGRRKTLLEAAESDEEKANRAMKSQAKAKRMSVIPLPKNIAPLRSLAVTAMIFLTTRTSSPSIGTLFVSIENGLVQVWSHHPAGGFLSSFSAIHSSGDYIISFATDRENEYLFTGTCSGYLKTWLVKGYMDGSNAHPTLPKYRLIFPYLWKDLWEGRAKRASREQKYPVLVNSFKAHTMPVSSIDYIQNNQILLSSSADKTARLWTLGGRYLATLGTFKPWLDIPENKPVEDDRIYTLPTDLKRVVSSTTLKVYKGGHVTRKKWKVEEEETKQLQEIDLNKVEIYKNRIGEPILGNHYTLPMKLTGQHHFTLDTSYPYIPVYYHLHMPKAETYVRPTTPDIIKEGRTVTTFF